MALTPQQILHKGHPTAPGPPDPHDLPRHGRQDQPGAGKPGISRLRPSPDGHGDGTPGNTPSGPRQPRTVYDNDRFGDDV